MERPVQVHVLADDPRDRAAWVAALAGMSALQIVAVGPVGAVDLDGDGAAVALVIGADDVTMNAEEGFRELARQSAPAVILVDFDTFGHVPASDGAYALDARLTRPSERHGPRRTDSSGEGMGMPVVARISADSSPERVAAAVVAVGFGLEVSDPLLADLWTPESAYFDLDEAREASSDGVHADPSFVSRTGDPEPLTGRERDVLEELVNGSTNRQIADVLGIAENTVKFHVASLLSKFGASTRTDLVVRAIQSGTLRV